jgi:hypothetical protein
MYAEGQRYFMGEGKLNNALTRLIADLKEHDIDYVVIGAIALLAYGLGNDRPGSIEGSRRRAGID